jgi:hypothetical protein
VNYFIWHRCSIHLYVFVYRVINLFFLLVERMNYHTITFIFFYFSMVEDLSTWRYIDEEMEELITDRLPLDTAIVIKIIMQSQHIESMTITKNIVLFVKWLWYEVDFTVGELTFIPKWCPEMQRICFIEHPNGSPEIYIKDAH